MALSSTHYPAGITYAIREDLSDIITNIAPTDTVFLSNIGKETATNKYHEWLTDTLSTAANCAVTEGNDAVAADILAQTRTGNYTQIAAKWFQISDTLETVDKAGRKSEIAYQTGRFLKMLARDMEFGLLNNTTSTSSNPRSSGGVKSFITTNQCSKGDIGYTTGTSDTTFTETQFNTAIQYCWTEGGNPTMVLAMPNMKRKLSLFTGNSKITTNMDAENKKIILSVDYYESDFGVVKVYASRFLESDQTASSPTSYEDVLILDKEMWAVATLQPLKTEKLAKTGLSTKIQMSTEYTLVSRQQKASAWMKNMAINP
jgi:hypothetical protein